VILVMLLVAAGMGGGSVLCYHVCAPIEAVRTVIRAGEQSFTAR
jgi:hypothetical protein